MSSRKDSYPVNLMRTTIISQKNPLFSIKGTGVYYDNKPVIMKTNGSSGFCHIITGLTAAQISLLFDDVVLGVDSVLDVIYTLRRSVY